MKKIFVCSPLRGTGEVTEEAIKNNQEKCREYCKNVVVSGGAPYAPHLLLTQFLDDNIELERKAGINCGIEFLKVCDEVWVFGDELSSGMIKEIEFANNQNIPVEFVNKELEEAFKKRA